jgi:tetratricopeptide (TPR) repeat protein
MRAGQFDEASAVCSAIPTGSEEDDCSVAVMSARILEQRGDIQQAFDLLNGMLEKYPDVPDVVLVFSDISRHLKRTEVATSLLEDQLERQHTPGIRTQLHFSLGRLYDYDRRYDEAFRQFQQANSLKPSVFDLAGHTAVIETLIETYTPEMLASFPTAGNQSQLPVFIVGMPRAGTTLVEQILSSHSKVFGAGELPYIGQMAVALSGKMNCGLPYPQCVHKLSQELLDTLARDYLERLQQKSATTIRVTDKQNGNYLHLGLIQLLLPRARIIHCMREPLDTCLSLYTHDMVGEATYTRSFEGLACYYKNYERLMHHWHEVLSLPVLDVTYESLVRNQEQETRNLLRFCGLEWEDQCLDFHENKRAVATPSHAQVRQPMYQSSIGRWQNYQADMSPLRSLLEG